MKIKNLKIFASTILVGSILLTPVFDSIGENKNVEVSTTIENNYPEWLQLQENPQYVDELLQTIYDYPVDLVSLFEERGVKVILLGKNGILEKIYNLPTLKGMYSTSERVIYVETYRRGNILNSYKSKKEIKQYTTEEFNVRVAKNTLLHELGHYFDLNTGIVSFYNSFKEIYLEEKDNFRKTREFLVENNKVEANIANQNEYFAEAMTCYILYPEDLLEYCPKTYEVIVNHINEYNNQNKKTK